MNDTNDRPIKDIEALGWRIAADRKRRSLSNAELAKASGVSQATISRLEHGQFASPSPENLQRIASALRTEVEDYFALAGYFTPHGLPGLRPYLRAKYGISGEVARELEDYFNYLNTREGDQGTTDSSGSRHKTN